MIQWYAPLRAGLFVLGVQQSSSDQDAGRAEVLSRVVDEGSGSPRRVIVSSLLPFAVDERDTSPNEREQLRSVQAFRHGTERLEGIGQSGCGGVVAHGRSSSVQQLEPAERFLPARPSVISPSGSHLSDTSARPEVLIGREPAVSSSRFPRVHGP